MKFAFTCLALLIASAQAHANNTLKDVQTSFDKDTFVADLSFAEDFNEDNLTVDFINNYLQVDLPNSSLEKSKSKTNHVNQDLVTSVYTYQVNSDLLHSRIILKKGLQAKNYQTAVEVVRDGKHVQIRLKQAKTGHEQISKTLPVIPPKALEQAGEILDDQIQKAALVIKPSEPAKAANDVALPEKTVQVGEPAKAAAPPSAASEKEKSVPVLSVVGTQTKSDQDAFRKMLMAVGIVAMMAMGLMFALRRWSGKNTKLKDSAKIKVISQHHLGPKKSLAIIHVAGESMLIGVTEQNISMIKSLALIDDEIPDQLPPHFGEALRHVEEPKLSIPIKSRHIADEEDEFSASGLSEIKGLISTRLKDMSALR